MALGSARESSTTKPTICSLAVRPLKHSSTVIALIKMPQMRQAMAMMLIATAVALREFTRGLLFDLGGKLQPFVLELGQLLL